MLLMRISLSFCERSTLAVGFESEPVPMDIRIAALFSVDERVVR
jgi:hypothetical protein